MVSGRNLTQIPVVILGIPAEDIPVIYRERVDEALFARAREVELGEYPAHEFGHVKVVVEKLRMGDVECFTREWQYRTSSGIRQLCTSPDYELAFFTHDHGQDVQVHEDGRETYKCLEGEMKIQLPHSKGEVLVELYACEEFTLDPGVVHEVLRETEFLCMTYRVGGEATDKTVINK